jgi:hypothetical protein
MKNLFLLPTNGILSPQYIYITRSVESKVGDYYIGEGFAGPNLFQWSKAQAEGFPDMIIQKVVLTNNPSLIQGDVRAIDDEFLEWFVKNPACESVEIKRLEDGQYVDYFPDGSVVEGIYENYKIVLPREEPKHIPYKGKVWEPPKQETLEEAAEKYVKSTADNDPVRILSFIQGAKWQAEQLFKDDAIQTLEKGLALLLKKQERMYSEEEVMDMFDKFSMHLPLHYEFLVREMFKKK